ncbi:hypothetical protein Poli38472_008847 [Pythium oligandrum]|uniref:ATP-dependent (S)-NAD(P)H-hydrate dehydratase n=1 Tax=Pythium oligandrum TaxID=41045 RepID=A0A8K1C472_PYTOL|nr:hypothetical protein Poli38472_008847 [Pythium oligandrum]|eukprot:TMW56199.1 hypothetical protein Poli38472_008847 [Pythium oligandrum]
MTPSKTKSLVERLIPPLTSQWRKGQQGRVGVVGGSFEYTGAPFYAGISALKTGADLCHIFCTPEAAIPIKSYSPELIVHPLLRSDASIAADAADEAIRSSVEKITQVFSRLDVLILGPGLGRDKAVLQTVRRLIQCARDVELPIVVDGDALFLTSEYPDVVQGYNKAILTPNAMEYARLCAAVKLIDKADPTLAAKIPAQELSKAFGSPVVIQKGATDVLSDGDLVMSYDSSGSFRRCGGQGDVLTGAIATFTAWSKHADLSDEFEGNPLLLAALGGAMVTRASSSVAFQTHGRSMTAPDVLQSIGQAFAQVFPDA